MAAEYQQKRTVEVILLPNLKHTGISTILDKITSSEIPVTNAEGRITHMYKDHSKKRLMPIYRDKKQFEGREAVFKTSHKQFIDKCLIDMEEQKTDKMERRMKHWKSQRSELGFDQSFKSNLDGFSTVTPSQGGSLVPSPVHAENSMEHKSVKFAFGDDDGNRLHHLHPEASNSHNRSPQSPTGSVISASASASSVASHYRRSRPASRMALFNELLEQSQSQSASSTGANTPKTPLKRYGSLATIVNMATISRDL